MPKPSSTRCCRKRWAAPEHGGRIARPRAARGGHGYGQRLRHTPAGLVRPARPPRPALAAPAHALPGVAVGSDAAADPGRHRHPLLPALHRALPHPARRGRGQHRRGHGALGRAGLLRPCPQPARRGPALRATAWRRPATRFRRPAGPARDRPQHRRRDPGPGLGRTLPDPGRQRQARARPLARDRRLARHPGGGKTAVGPGRGASGRSPGRTHGRLHPGADGLRRQPMHPFRTGLPGLPAGRRLQCPARRPGRHPADPAPGQGPARARGDRPAAGKRPRPTAAATTPAHRDLGQPVDPAPGRHRGAVATMVRRPGAR